MLTVAEPRPESIDPFSTAYWENTPAPASTLTVQSKETKANITHGLMNPPRLPLTSWPNSIAKNFNVLVNGKPDSKPGKVAGAPTALAVKPKRIVPPEQLPEFKAAIAGSDMTKIALVEALKKQ
jgi:chromatin assembly factor 1 subunit A